jgi:hypothetical protein
MGGFRFHIYAEDGEDLGVRTFSVSNWKPGDTIALRDRVYLVRDVVALDAQGAV